VASGLFGLVAASAEIDLFSYHTECEQYRRDT
jgi:hypothetical protein